jgi:hypothetical protein
MPGRHDSTVYTKTNLIPSIRGDQAGCFLHNSSDGCTDSECDKSDAYGSHPLTPSLRLSISTSLHHSIFYGSIFMIHQIVALIRNAINRMPTVLPLSVSQSLCLSISTSSFDIRYSTFILHQIVAFPECAKSHAYGSPSLTHTLSPSLNLSISTSSFDILRFDIRHSSFIRLLLFRNAINRMPTVLPHSHPLSVTLSLCHSISLSLCHSLTQSPTLRSSPSHH